MPRISLDGAPIEAQAQDTVAAALLRAGVTTFTRSIKYHRPRGPFCFAGSCGQCLMRIDGLPSLLACRVPVAEGMRCERQNGPLGVENDLFRAADFLFPEGLDHHHLLVRSRLLGRVALEIARRLAGLGEVAVVAEHVAVATGGVSQPLPFPGVDRPGVYAARGLLALGARVGLELAVVGEGEEAKRCAEALSRRGYEIAMISGVPRRALGNPVKAVDTAAGTRIRCDAVAIAQPPAPLHELASSAGAQAHFDGAGFPVQTDAEGRTSVPWLFAAGTVAGKPAVPSREAAGSAACR